ncbi:MAG: hypothetical protein AAF318_18870 [Pseudomonadota bacterium]
MKALTDRARKFAIIAAASVCLILGLLTVWTPLPTGVPLIAVGVVLLVTVSATARRMVRQARAKSRRVDIGVAFVETRAGRGMATMLKRTRPLARKMEAKRAMQAATRAIKSARVTPQKTPGKGPST